MYLYSHTTIIIFESFPICALIGGTSAFSVGIKWVYYGLGNEEYRVQPRYQNLKEEMLEYPEISSEEIGDIMRKANHYIHTETCRSLRADTKDHEPITTACLICLILYCDFSELSRRFTLSFRKSSSFETMEQVKSRNAKYFHWSVTLKDAISSFGQDHGIPRGVLPYLRGPFFCGMSIPLNIPQFAMYIYGPTSTSIHIEVATRFSGGTGIILEMDNSKGKARELKGMDVSFISRFREEDERYDHFSLNSCQHLFYAINSLFFGCSNRGSCPMDISSIRVVDTSTNYKQIIQSISLLDAILNKNISYGNKPSISVWNAAIPILSHLFNYQNEPQNLMNIYTKPGEHLSTTKPISK